MNNPRHYFLVSFKCGATGGGNMLRIQDAKEITALSLKCINEGIREDLGRMHWSTGFFIQTITYLGCMTEEEFGDVTSWQQAAEPSSRQRQI